jgi:outer membrane protein
LNLTQNLLNFQAWYSYQGIKKSDQVAALTLAQAEQELIMRVSTAYFDVLRAQADLTSLQAEETAAQQLLEQTQQRFDVGLIPITDVNDNFSLVEVPDERADDVIAALKRTKLRGLKVTVRREH